MIGHTKYGIIMLMRYGEELRASKTVTDGGARRTVSRRHTGRQPHFSTERESDKWNLGFFFTSLHEYPEI